MTLHRYNFKADCNISPVQYLVNDPLQIFDWPINLPRTQQGLSWSQHIEDYHDSTQVDLKKLKDPQFNQHGVPDIYRPTNIIQFDA